MAMREQRCAYCGSREALTRDHVFPSALYPPSKQASRLQRITIHACAKCNRGWSNDEAHFRNVLIMCGESNAAVRELWSGPINRSFEQCDGYRRVRDVVAQLVPVETPQGLGHMIYPARDPRVMRIVRKIIRGLCHRRGLLSPVAEDQVWADVYRYAIPEDILKAMTFDHAERDIVQYGFGLCDDDPDMHSCWLISFFEKVKFFGVVYRSGEAQQRLRKDAA